MPFPNKATQFKKGQTGNPNGYSRSRRVSDALGKLLDQLAGADDDLARTFWAMATGRKRLLIDAKTGEKRTPEWQWFAALLERLEGKVADKLITQDETVVVERKDRKKRRKAKSPPRRPPRRTGEGEG